jgi:hypothetical protein
MEECKALRGEAGFFKPPVTPAKNRVSAIITS